MSAGVHPGQFNPPLPCRIGDRLTGVIVRLHVSVNES